MEIKDTSPVSQEGSEHRGGAPSAPKSSPPAVTSWERLKKHKVAQWTLAYAAAAYTLLHAVEMVSGALQWPHIIVRVVTLLLLLGLPVVTTLAWFHGHKAQHRVSGPELGILTLLLVIAAGVLWYLGRPSREQVTEDAASHVNASGAKAATGEAAPARSIAVLPFVDMSEMHDQEYFSDGLAEELLNRLTKVRELQVAARTSPFYFKGKAATVSEIADALNVAHVLEGSVRQSGDTVRITVQLIRADNGYHVWSETYDRHLEDVLRVQDEIATAVVEHLQVTLVPAATTARSVNPAAYSLYLQAHYLKRQFTAEALVKAEELYKKALALDPGFAPAWVELGSTYRSLGDKGVRPVAESYSNAQEAVANALAADPASAQAHAELGSIALSYGFDYVAAAAHLQRALEVDPENVQVLAHAANLTYVLGRQQQAIQIRKFIAARDPLWANAHYNLGMLYCLAGRSDEAVAEFSRAIQLSPQLIGAYSMLGLALQQKGDGAAAVRAVQQESFEAWRLIALAMVYHGLGQPAQSDAALEELTGKYGNDWPYNIAYVYAFRNERDLAFDWLDQALERGDTGIGEIAGNTFFANLYGDARWLPFLTRIGKAPEKLAKIRFDVALPESESMAVGR